MSSALAVVDREHRRSKSQTTVQRILSLRGSALGRLTELRALETAREQVEARYLDGHHALFPATIRAWAGQRERTEGLADLAIRIAEHDGLDPAPPDEPAAFEARVVQLVADHVEPARVKALDEIGEGRRAASVALRWLEPILGSSLASRS